VQLVAYELRFALGEFQPPQPPEFPPASGADMELFYAHLLRVMVSSGFLNPANPRHLERKLRRLFNRAHPDVNELGILRGVLAAAEKHIGEPTASSHDAEAQQPDGDDAGVERG
jgi:tRNA C32,U32 (ribose-2'-O)-methylase TrmJ